ncbi:MAG: SIS domain-containing protein [Sphingobacteriales bacterium]|nr:MAG: SIS domain-containing protein [Sphingobacteriales bacterium]
MKYQGKDLATFPRQIQFVLKNYERHNLKISDFDNIIICGLGGSGIAGRFIKTSTFLNFPVPIEVVSGYEVPAYAGPRTLAIQCSYSGNTEETLSMYAASKQKGAKMLCIATGGKLEELANQDNIQFYRAEKGYQPRMALGYPLTYLFLIFDELTGTNNGAELENAARILSNEKEYIDQATELLEQVKPHFPKKFVVITDYAGSATGLRFCQQLQENTKIEAFLVELPESNHNVIESYYGKLDSIYFFINTHSNPRTDLRFTFIRDLLEGSGDVIFDIDFDAKNLTEMLQKVYVLDWLTLLLADHAGKVSSDIRNINALKNYLSER